MYSPTISVIIPLFNKGAIIKRTIQSVLSQSFTNYELIIVNDGSTDDSAEVVKGIKDDRIIYFEQENGGPSKARNKGVENSHGEWFLFLDADDELTEGALEHMWEMTISHSKATIIDGSFIVRNGKTEKPTIFSNKYIRNNYKSFFYKKIKPSSGHSLFKKELIKRYPYNPSIRRYEDFELIMRLLNEAEIVTTSKPILYVNSSFSNASMARKTINEDFVGHLDFVNKSFWEYMCLYQLYLWERDYYPEEIKKLYPNLHRRYDLLLLYRILMLFRS